jgi:hypothetical protein
MATCGQQIVIRRPNHQHTHGDITDFGSAVLDIINDTVISTTGFVHLSGDTMTGGLYNKKFLFDKTRL